MPYFLRIVDGKGVQEGYLLGYPDSHGCIRMPGWMARWFFKSAPLRNTDQHRVLIGDHKNCLRLH